MSVAIARVGIDYILSEPNLLREENVTWDFIGGEPLLEIDLIEQVVDYIQLQLDLSHHPCKNHW